MIRMWVFRRGCEVEKVVCLNGLETGKVKMMANEVERRRVLDKR